MGERETVAIKLSSAGEPIRSSSEGTPPPRGTFASLVVLEGEDFGRRIDIGLVKPVRFERAGVGDDAPVLMAEVSIVDQRLELRAFAEGVFVNERAIESCELRHGDRLRVGAKMMRVLFSEDLQGAYQEEIYRLATHDDITDAFNRRYLMENLEQLTSRSRRWEAPLSLAVVRLGNLALFRKERGEEEATKALRRLASVLLDLSRGDDIVARISDEEFAVALFNTDRGRAELFADRVRQIPAGAQLELVVGIAMMDATIMTAEIFLEEARSHVLPWSSSSS